MSRLDAGMPPGRTGAKHRAGRPVAGDSITALFGFDHGVRGFFDSTANLNHPGRMPYGLLVEIERAALHIRRLGEVYVYPAPLVLPEDPELAWEKMTVPIPPDQKQRLLDNWLRFGNMVLVSVLIDPVEQDRESIASGQDAHIVVEMIQGVYASHFSGGQRLSIPLAERWYPIE